jgi:uncharacterized protein (DUF305 family)
VTAVSDPVETRRPPAAGPPRRLLALLAAVTALALLGAGGALAVLTGIGGTRPPAETSVDAGFARDMSTHHTQAVEMAQVARDRGSDPEVRLLAYDIETQQLGQVGQMRGWLQTWGQTPQSDVPVMAWMSEGHSHSSAEMAGHAMPGMATTAELDKLRSLSGRALDVYFLQLMIRHHRGAFSMAGYAAQHAAEPYVRDLASKMVAAQQAEVVTMERMLRERGGEPLPYP